MANGATPEDRRNPARKAPKGETAAQRKTRQRNFYHSQRVMAEDEGDQGTVNRIYKKLGKNAPGVGGTDRVDRQIMGAVPEMALGGGIAKGVLGGIGKLAGPAIKGVEDLAQSGLSRLGGRAAAKVGSQVAKRAESSVAKSGAGRAGARVVGKAKVEPSTQKALPSAKATNLRSSARVKTPRKFTREELQSVKKAGSAQARKVIAKSRAKAAARSASRVAKPKVKTAARVGPAALPKKGNGKNAKTKTKKR